MFGIRRSQEDLAGIVVDRRLLHVSAHSRTYVVEISYDNAVFRKETCGSRICTGKTGKTQDVGYVWHEASPDEW